MANQFEQINIEDAFKEINTEFEEGKLLKAALTLLQGINFVDKTPLQILKQVVNAKNQMEFNDQQIEKFESGKCYKNIMGQQMRILGIIESFQFGVCFISEDLEGNFSHVEMNNKKETSGWEEIPLSQFNITISSDN